MSIRTRQLALKERPTGLVGPEHFTMREATLPDPGAGEVLLEVLYLSCDPTQRGWLNPVDTYVPAIKIGETMRAGGVGRVVASGDPAFKPGDLVNGTVEWADHVITRPNAVVPMTKLPDGPPPSWALSVYGITGLTAYFGLLNVGAMKTGDAVLVSGAAGATGSTAGQIARLKGASKVVGIAGGPKKCAYVVDELGFDACIDYKSDDIAKRVRALFPKGVDVYFDNVGGVALEAALINLAMKGRIVLCGGISTGYTPEAPGPGPSNYFNLVLRGGRMEGFLVLEYVAQFGAAAAELIGWAASGKLKVAEHIVKGLDQAPMALQGLFTGANTGKTIVEVKAP